MSHAWGENRIMTFLPEARAMHAAFIQGKKNVAIPAPRFISSWISEKCNLDCTYCFFSDTNHDKSHLYINEDAFLEWLAQARYAGAEALEFSGGGEPTLHPKFQHIFEGASLMGYKLGIITHACNDMPLAEMVKKFKYVRCGLDAATASTHDLIKRNKRKDYWFHKAIENIKELVRLRDQNNPDGFTVGIKIVLNTINYHELQAMIDLAVDLNVDYIQIKREHSSDHDLNIDQITEANRIIRHDGQTDFYNKRTKVKGTMDHQEATTKCFMSAIHTVVTATGKILQCCFFENRPIGTIFQPFDEAWGSEAHRKVVEMTTVSECAKVDCRWNFYNQQMQQVLEDPLSQVSFI